MSREGKHGSSWTSEEKIYLRQAHSQGFSRQEMADKLGRSLNAVVWELGRLDLIPADQVEPLLIKEASLGVGTNERQRPKQKPPEEEYDEETICRAKQLYSLFATVKGWQQKALQPHHQKYSVWLKIAAQVLQYEQAIHCQLKDESFINSQHSYWGDKLRPEMYLNDNWAHDYETYSENHPTQIVQLSPEKHEAMFNAYSQMLSTANGCAPKNARRVLQRLYRM